MMDAVEFLASVLREKNEPSSAHSDAPEEEGRQEASDACEEEGRQEASQGLDDCSDAEASRSDNSSDDSSDNSSDEASLGSASNDDSFEGDTEDAPKFHNVSWPKLPAWHRKTAATAASRLK